MLTFGARGLGGHYNLTRGEFGYVEDFRYRDDVRGGHWKALHVFYHTSGPLANKGADAKERVNYVLKSLAYIIRFRREFLGRRGIAEVGVYQPLQRRFRVRSTERTRRWFTTAIWSIDSAGGREEEVSHVPKLGTRLSLDRGYMVGPITWW